MFEIVLHDSYTYTVTVQYRYTIYKKQSLIRGPWTILNHVRWVSPGLAKFGENLNVALIPIPVPLCTVANGRKKWSYILWIWHYRYPIHNLWHSLLHKFYKRRAKRKLWLADFEITSEGRYVRPILWKVMCYENCPHASSFWTKQFFPCNNAK